VPQRTQNAVHHAREIGINIRIPKSKYPETLRPQKRIANLVRLSTVRQSVLATICFDNEPGSEGHEVDNVTADRGLSPKVITKRLQFAQLHPQFGLLRGETFAKRARNFVRHDTPNRLFVLLLGVLVAHRNA
jgi:hypothetical protein